VQDNSAVEDAKMFIGELSRRTKVNIETVRYYERKGIMPSPPRTESGHRIYDENHLKRLSFVRRCRELGFGLDSVMEMLRMVDGGGVTCEQVRTVSKNHLDDVRLKIADLKRLEKTLNRTVSLCEGGKDPDCPIIEALYFGEEER
jgi:MerR family transcriptional regulator, mercuric resistance operon regulatory protein